VLLYSIAVFSFVFSSIIDCSVISSFIDLIVILALLFVIEFSFTKMS